jgi:hypothetical protein
MDAVLHYLPGKDGAGAAVTVFGDSKGVVAAVCGRPLIPRDADGALKCAAATTESQSPVVPS